MKQARFLLIPLLALLLDASILFSFVAFMDSLLSHMSLFHGLGLWYLFAGGFAFGVGLRIGGRYLYRWEAVLGGGVYWAGVLLHYWILCTVFSAVVLRLDFSGQGVACAFFFFLWPVEYLALRIGPYIGMFASFFGALALATGVVVVAQLQDSWGNQQ